MTKRLLTAITAAACLSAGVAASAGLGTGPGLAGPGPGTASRAVPAGGPQARPVRPVAARTVRASRTVNAGTRTRVVLRTPTHSVPVAPAAHRGHAHSVDFLKPEPASDRHRNGRADMIAPQHRGGPWTHVDLADPGQVGPVHGMSLAQITAATGGASLHTRAGPTLAADGGSGPVTAATTATPTGTSSVPGLTRHVATDCSGTDTGNTGNRVQVLYAHESGTPDRYSSVVGNIKNVLADIDDAFAMSSEQTGGGRRVRWVEDANCSPTVLDVTLPATVSVATSTGSVTEHSLGSDPNATFTALTNAGYTSAARKYLLFADYTTGLYNGAASGVAQFYQDDSTTGNYNDGKAALDARVDYWALDTAGHELMHTLGAVENTSPHHTDNGHCTDGTEMMCYADGSSQTYNPNVCPSGDWAQYDCNHDDYFNTNPAAGSYLASHWDTANSSFLATATPLPALPAVNVTADKSTFNTGETVTFTATADRAVTYTWGVNTSGCTKATPTAATFTLTCPGTMPSTDLTVSTTGTDANGMYSTVKTTVHLNRLAAPTVAVSSPGQTLYVDQPATITGTATGSSLTFQWTVSNSGCTIDGATNQTSLTFTCPASTRGQNVRASVTVTQSDGQTASAATPLLSITAPAPTLSVTGPGQIQAGTTGTFTAATDSNATVAWTGPDSNAWQDTTSGTTVNVTVPADVPDQTPESLYATATNTYGVATHVTVTFTVTAAAANTTPVTTGPTPTPDATAVSLRARNGYPTRFTGVLTDTSTGAPVSTVGLPVALQVRWPGSSRWQTLTTAATSSTGQVATSWKLATRPGTFRFAFPGTTAYTTAVSPTRWAKVPTTVTANIRTGSPDRVGGVAATRSGARLRWTTLVLQRRWAGTRRWIKVAAPRTGRTGTVSVKVRPRRHTYYRWVLAGTSQRLGSTSRQVYVRR